MRVAVMTDTNSGISVEEGQALGITVIPMPVIVDGNCYMEHESIRHADLYEQMRQHKDVSTSQPSPQVLCDKWTELLDNGYDEVVFIPMSSGLSNTCGTAMTFAKEFDGKVFVVDNHRISVTLKESVLDAKALADLGKSGDEIKALLEQNAYNASIYITVDSMEYLLKNGRATRAAATIATALNIKPVLTIQGEKLDAFKKVHGIKKCLPIMIDAIKKDIKTRFSSIPQNELRVAAAGTLESDDEINKLMSALAQEFPDREIEYCPLSCSIACHVGIGAIGLAVCRTQGNR